MESFVLNTYGRVNVHFEKGEGAVLFDKEGKRYIDLLGGIAVVSVGHGHPKVAAAISEQASRLSHVSNLFWTTPMLKLAEKLSEISGGGFQSFFCNSGAEAAECGIKFIRKASGEKRDKIVCAHGSFHGRTLGALAATGQPSKWKGFEPMIAGFEHAEFNNLESFEKCIGDDTAGVIVEPVQGEGGIHPAEPEFLRGLSQLCSERGALLMFDEVQTGCGRTGSWWAWQEYGVKPDLFASAKGLGNGMPIGACLVSSELAHHFAPGDHGSTFGGGLVQSIAALTTLQCIEDEDLLGHARESGTYLSEELAKLPQVKQVRGLGLMRAAQLHKDSAKALTEKLLERGVVVNNVCPDAMRITPPLCISKEEIKEAVQIIGEVLSGI